MDDLSNSVIFPWAGSCPGNSARIFTGQAYLEMLSGGGDGFNCPIGNVTFEPGCRNNWHRHPGGQILLVTGGRGWYRKKAGPPGRSAPETWWKIPPDVKHWHGAAKDSWFVHLSIETNSSMGPAQWLEPVTDEEYEKLERGEGRCRTSQLRCFRGGIKR